MIEFPCNQRIELFMNLSVPRRICSLENIFYDLLRGNMFGPMKYICYLHNNQQLALWLYHTPSFSIYTQLSDMRNCRYKNFDVL